MFRPINIAGLLIGACVWGCGTPALLRQPPTHEPPELASAAAVSLGDQTTPTKPSERGWGSISGRFVYRGALPEKRYTRLGRDDARLLGLETVAEESLVVDPATRGISNIFVYAHTVSRIHEAYADASDDPAVLLQGRGVYRPRAVALRVGQPLSVENGDSVIHIVRMSPVGDMETNVLLGQGRTLTRVFSRNQLLPIPVTCGFHECMKAYVFVRENPYVAVTDAYGSFYIADLPAGEEIQIRLWHERGRGPRGALVAKPEWVNGRFHVTIPLGETVSLGTIEVPSTAFWTKKPWHLDL